jgi:hypothetical protein
VATVIIYGTFFVIKPFKPKLDFANRVYYTVCKSNPNLSSGIVLMLFARVFANC